ncbi:MAG: alpha/beta hydrolase, partial [Acidobacteria bacterium]|nr:alpha/beta hydrolase [Acidobacteriota bacterium]
MLKSRAVRAGAVGVLAIAAWLAAPPVLRYARAVSALLRIEDAARQPSFLEYPVEERPATVKWPGGEAPARLYLPKNVASAPGIVVLHGIHHLGIGEPRLVNFARVMAASGFVVLTPELAAVADYRIEPSAIAIIGASARRLATEMQVPRVGVLGLSFAGGLALMAAADPQWSQSIAWVAAIGAHHDLGRVVKFLVTGSAPRPDGSVLHLAAHEYGALITVYDRPEDFFSPADAPAARESLRLLLWEK